jgi:enoyl-CoA hydratase / 3-hydroxyacyl-CoA dehydrogenase
MFVFKAAVVGAGTMGGQIAQTIAATGTPVALKDISEELVQAGVDEARAVTEGQVGRLVERGKLTSEQAQAQVEEVLGCIHPTVTYEGFGDVDFVIEAVPEKMAIKQTVLAELDACTPSPAILASNTSSLSIAELGEATLRPEQVVGFHYFYPASLMPLIEIVRGERTSLQTTASALVFAQAIRKQPITCADAPGFVVNRILSAGISEVFREQEQRGLSIKRIDEGMGSAGVVPMGPYLLVNLLGLDTVLHVAEYMAESYGPERFYVHEGMRKLVSEGKLGAKTGGEGLYNPQGEPNLEGDAEPDLDELLERLTLATFIEACLVLQERIATHRDIDFGMMAGAGLDPRRGLMPPFLRADVEGLGTILERLESAQERHGDRFAPPVILRRLVAQRRLGQSAGQGFYPYPQPDSEPGAQPSGGDGAQPGGGDGAQPGPGQHAQSGAEQGGETVKLELRRDGVAIAWLANGQLNSISPQVIGDLSAAWERAKASEPHVRALVIASSNPFVYCAGADIKSFTSMDEASGERMSDAAHALFTELGADGVATIAAVNGLAFGGGCELAMACDVRLAARSAIFGQPEIRLGIIPGFGGTQRLPRLVGRGRGLELNLIGDPILAEQALSLGLVSEVVEDHELFETSLSWARKLAGQAPLALASIKAVSAVGEADRIEAEQRAFRRVFESEDAREGIAAFLGRRRAHFEGS